MKGEMHYAKLQHHYRRNSNAPESMLTQCHSEPISYRIRHRTAYLKTIQGLRILS